jgi:integrase
VSYKQAFINSTKRLDDAELAAVNDAKHAGFDLRTYKGRRDWTAVQLLRGTGMRCSEVAGGTGANGDPIGVLCERITARTIKAVDQLVLDFAGKGGRRRRVILTGDKLALVNAYLRRRPGGRTAGPLFLACDRHGSPIPGRAMGRNALYRVVREMGDRAGVARLHPHRFRHEAASRAGESGVPLPVLMGHFGWSTTAMAARYMCASDASLANCCASI